MKNRTLVIPLIGLALSIAACSPVAVNNKTVQKTIPQQEETEKPKTTQKAAYQEPQQKQVLLGDEYKPTGEWCFHRIHKVCLSNLEWSYYSENSARASGKFSYCPPQAQESPCGSGPATIYASTAQTVCGKERFARLQLDAQGQSIDFDYSPVYPGAKQCDYLSGADLTPLMGTPRKVDRIQDCGQSVQNRFLAVQNTRNWDCQKAWDDLLASESRMSGADSFRSMDGFACAATTGKRRYQWVEMRCQSGSKAYRFETRVYD